MNFSLQGAADKKSLDDTELGDSKHTNEPIEDGSNHHYSYWNVLHWDSLPHFHYRRLLHNLFAHSHFYHPVWLPRGSTIAATANLVASTIGVGTLAHPFAMRSCGVTAYLILGALTVTFTIFSQFLLCKCVDATRYHSYEMISRHFFKSRNVEHAVEVMMILNCFGVCVAYVVVAGDISQQLGSAFSPVLATPSGRLYAQLGIFLTTMLPLSLVRTIGALKYASAVGIVAIAALILFISEQGITLGVWSNVTPIFVGAPSGVLSGLPLIFFGFLNQINGIEIYSEMKPRSPAQFAKISFFATGLVWVAYTLVAFGGLSVFGAAVDGNILRSFGTLGMSPFAAVATAGILTKSILTFPLLQFPCREALLHLTGVENVQDCSYRMFASSTILLSGGALVVAIFVPTVTILFGVLGAVCCALFGFVLPAVFAWQLEEVSPSHPALFSILTKALFCYGLFGGAVGTVFSILSIT
jgi:amino acid permease